MVPAVAGRDEKRSAREPDDDDDARDRDEARDDEPGDDGADEGVSDERARRVARSLGVDDDADDQPVDGADASPEGEAAEEPEEDKPQNRAARRREQALERRKKRLAASKGEGSEQKAARAGALETTDKNARAKALLERRRAQAQKGGDDEVAAAPALQGLTSSEMVDDALARASSRIVSWLKNNVRVLQWGALAVVLGGGFAVYWFSRQDAKTAEASALLASATRADRGRVMAEDDRSAEEKELDTARVFKTEQERRDATLAAYREVTTKFPGTGAALLARLGEATTLLAKRQWGDALAAFDEVSKSNLAKADPDVKARALEGAGYAKEGKGDLDGALASFKELEAVEGKGWKELSQYHQGRVLLDKGDKDKAKEILTALHTKLKTPTPDGAAVEQLLAMVGQTLRKIDPALAPEERSSLMGAKGGMQSLDEAKNLMQRARERGLEKAMKEQDEHGDEEH
jgi:hypothetical protein